MFTGIIETIGRIRDAQRRTEGVRLSVESDLDLSQARLGDSVAVMGVCLTVTSLGTSPGRGVFSADVAFESLERTTLGQLQRGSRVHLERALPAHGRLDGHIVQGHVDGVGRLASITPRGDASELEFELDESWALTIVEKGSIAVDGTSLTVNQCEPGRFRVGIVPHTLHRTLLGERRVGDRVNIETDILGKYVIQALRLTGATAGGTSSDDASLRDALQRNGFWR